MLTHPPKFLLQPNQEATAQRIFAVAPQKAFGFQLLSVQIGHASIQASYKNLLDNTRVTLTLLHPNAHRDGPGVRTPNLQIFPSGNPPSRTALGLAMLVARNAARPENSLGWMLPPELDVELIAVLAGIKPALRSALRPELANNATARLQSLGLAVCSLQQPITFDGAPWTILYGARENAIAAALQELEGRQFNLQEPEYSKVQREIGRLLGFPDCCVKAFCQRLHPPETAGGVTNYPLDDAYLATAHAWTEKAAARLNPLLFGEQTYLISFEPCSFRCPEALRVADAIAGAVSAHHPEALARLDHALAVPIAVHPSGARARLVLERTHKKIYIQTATPIRRVHGEPIPEAYKQIAGSLIGAEIGTDGRVFGSGTPPVIVVDFKTQCGP